jgi:hypothetical protein
MSPASKAVVCDLLVYALCHVESRKPLMQVRDGVDYIVCSLSWDEAERFRVEANQVEFWDIVSWPISESPYGLLCVDGNYVDMVKIRSWRKPAQAVGVHG